MPREEKKRADKRKPFQENGLDNIFRMTVLASKRAKEILMGGKPLVDTQNTHPCLIAIEEIRKGKVKYKETK